MVSYTLKLRLTRGQERTLLSWLLILTSIWNWAIVKLVRDRGAFIGQKGARATYYRLAFGNLLVGTSKRLDVPSHIVRATLLVAYDSWARCFAGLARRPRFKGVRRPLNSIPFPDLIPAMNIASDRVRLLGLGPVRFHRQQVPAGRWKCARIIRRASGWYLCVFIEAEPNAIPVKGHGVIGIDPGFKNLLALSTGEKIEHPRELEATALRLAQAQRGHDLRLAARLQERIQNQRKDRNHKLSRELVSRNATIVFSKDNIRGIASSFGRSVASSAHGQLRSMLAYKCHNGSRRYIEVASRNSTKRCSSCEALTGPTGWAGLRVRHWVCAACGAEHDRDVNAAVNTLHAGLGSSLESAREGASGNLLARSVG